MGSVIKVEKVSKQYRLGLVNSGTMRDDLTSLWYRVRGKESPLLQLGEANDRSTVGKSDYVWSLKDIDFEVEQGEILGIIGKNGAGKSTLLKVLSKVTAPTTGVIKSVGRIASLLEVGTGFHPELTGRENIYLNGAILGMRRREITRKLDEIIDFSGVERYINTPVKRYSSGMYVRLAFAVAAHLESEILIVDEVLSVGDAEFQKKCMGKIGDISSGEGRTVLFVSHNMQAVTQLCSKGLLLDNGKINFHGEIEDCVKKYLTSSNMNDLGIASLDNRLSRTSGSVLFTSVKAINKGKESWEFDHNQEVLIKFKLECIRKVPSLGGFIALSDPISKTVVTNYNFLISDEELKENELISFEFRIPSKTLRTGQYSVYIALSTSDYRLFYDVLDDNVNLPLLSINPSSMNIYENSGYFTSPFKISI
jgi:lipopolysaccharide transport system ATP-binding protein